VRNEDAAVPGAGRFNYGQKLLFWVMAWGAVILLLSGLVMWYVAVVPPEIRSLATLVHAVAALVTIGAFIVHVYMGVAVVPGGLTAIVRGEVTEEWARHHHPLWLRSLRPSAVGGRLAGTSPSAERHPNDRVDAGG
jgi:formate dehydrogenase subunit gamma